jgi:hypothetical protein
MVGRASTADHARQEPSEQSLVEDKKRGRQPRRGKGGNTKRPLGLAVPPSIMLRADEVIE